MSTRSKRKNGKRRVANEIMTGMRELERMMDEGKTPEQVFIVKTIDRRDSKTVRARRASEQAEHQISERRSQQRAVDDVEDAAKARD